MTSHEQSVEDWGTHLELPTPTAELLTWLSTGTLTEGAAQTAREHRDKIALAVGDHALTHGQLDDKARRLATWLSSRGAGPGQRVVIAAPNSVSFAVAYLAVLHTGSSVSLVHPGLRARELHDLLDLLDPVVSIGSAERVGQFRDRKEAGTVLAIEEATSDPIASLDPLPVQELPPETVAHLAFTSGTTGRPKLVPLTHRNIVASVRAVALAWRWDHSDVLAHGLPLQHAHGLTAIHLSVLTGSTSMVLESFEPDPLCELVERHHATVVFGVPSMYERLLRSDQFSRHHFATVRLIISGSAPLAPPTFAAIEAATGQPPLERYGLTEAGFVLSNEYAGVRRPGSVGLPLPGIELQLVDADGRPVADGLDGEIVVRGPQVFAGYESRSDDDGTDDSFFPGAWFRTGDVGRRFPESGAISITGRLKELIVTGGSNVYPREVELVLESQPGVAAAAVVGMASAEWGEAVTAVIVPRPNERVDVDDLASTLRELLAPHKRPKRYYFVEELPRNHMGKLVRAQLTRELEEGSVPSSQPNPDGPVG